ncbi:MAG: hypothetical protein ACI857_000918 [Arenicella sp.]
MKQLLHILLSFVAGISWSQKEWVNAAVDATTVTSNDVFQYQISTDCDCEIIAPDLSEFEVLSAQTFDSHTSNFINGHSSEECTTSLTYTLRGKKNGKFKIGKAKAKCDRIETEAIEEISIEVLNAEDVHAAAQGKAPYYFNIETKTKSVVVGEPFIVDFYMFTDMRPQDITTITSGNAGGVYRQNLFQETAADFSFPLTVETIKGKQYYKIHLRQEVLIPSASGDLTVESYFGRAVERYEGFNAIYMEGYSNALQVKVKDVPNNAPENYYGMAGKFELTHEISKTTVPAKHAIELHLKISGTGNFNSFRLPDFLFPESFNVNEDEPIENFSLTKDGITGSVEFIYILTPTKEGKFNILPYSFGYYDWHSKTFKSVATESFEITVTEGQGGDIYNPGDPVTPIENDIRHIHKNASLFSMMGLFGGILFWILVLIPLLFASIYFFMRRKKSNLTVDEKVAIEQKSVKKSVAKDVKNIQKSEATDIRQLKSSLDEYLMTNLGIGRSQLSKVGVSERLTEKGVSEELRTELARIWDSIEMAQYAPISNENLDKLAGDTSSLINQLNKVL